MARFGRITEFECVVEILHGKTVLVHRANDRGAERCGSVDDGLVTVEAVGFEIFVHVDRQGVPAVAVRRDDGARFRACGRRD